jgi:RND family efflux transporter MFP subunit
MTTATPPSSAASPSRAAASQPAGQTPPGRARAFAERPARSSGNRRLFLLIVLVALGIGGGLLYYWINRPVAEVARVQRGIAISAVYGTVKIDYLFQQNLKAENTGYIDLAEGIFGGPTGNGFVVKQGQLLGSIRDDATQRQLNLALNEQAAAQARQKQGPGSWESLRSAEDRLSRLERAGPTVPEAERTAARNTVTQLRAQVANEKTELQRQVDQSELNVKAAQDILKRAEIRSPIEGFLVAAPPINHELVFQNNTLFTIAAKDLYVSGQVNEEDVGELREGMKAALKLYAYGGTEFQATLQSVLPSGDTSNSRYTVVLNLDDKMDNLRAGLTGEMNILIGKHPDSLIMPARALRDPDKSGDRIWLVEDGVVKPRTVKIGYRNPQTVEILDGLKAGDAVIVTDQDLFAAGQRVREVNVDATKLADKK